MKRILITFATICFCSQIVFAQFSGSGSGTSSDPYRIFNADQLTQLRNFLNQEGVYFKLQNDLDLTDWLAENYPGQGWQPVGSSAEPFKGILDGNNKTISGFSITRSSTDYVGLFAYVTGATIKDLTLKGDISGKAYVGSLMGRGTATVTNYTFEGTVTGTGSYTGGVGGYQSTASTNLTVKATVKGANYTGGVYGYGAGITTATFTGQVTGSSSYVGGLEGSASGTFSACTVTAPVKSSSSSAQYVGGLIGYARAAITASNCKQIGIVQGKSYTGGLVGYAPANVTLNNCIHRNDITGSTNTGGAIGGSKDGAVNLTSCYVEGNITGTTSVGGICGIIQDANSSMISGCHYWGNINGNGCLGGIVGKRENDSYIDFNSTVTAGQRGAFNGLSVLDSKCFFKEAPQFDKRSSDDWYYVSSSRYVLTTEIKDWATSYRTFTYLYGTHTIANVPYVVYCNLIDGSTATSSIITSIVNCSANGDISGSGSDVGGIIGNDWATDNKSCTLSESIKVLYYEDGATSLSSLTLRKYKYAYKTTNISESYYSGNLKGTDNIGGIAGKKKGGCINNCYASASISGVRYVGGIAGRLSKDQYDSNENSMNANVSVSTNITGTEDVGRIYGSTDGNFTVAALGTNSENRSMASTQVVKNGVTQTITDNLQNGTAVGVSQLRLRANYVAWGWDFNNSWTIQETENFPYKTWQSAPPTFIGKLASGATTISGKSIDGGTVHITTSSGKTYTATCNGNTWSRTVSALHAGETVTAYAAATNKEKSYFTTTTVGFLGSGTESDPYQITSAEDLQGINTGGYYKIMNDINLTSWINQYSSSKGWLPVGYDGASVYIDGDNHKISGLWTNTTDNYVGLFSKLKDGHIKNLNVEMASGKKVIGGTNTGGLIGYANNFMLSNCSVKGDVQGTGKVGGIVGYFSGNTSSPNLTDLTYEGKLNSSSSSAVVGGIAGYGSTCRMYHSSTKVQIASTGSSGLIGGLVGHLSGRSVSQCFADVNISASGKESQVGGLFGKSGYSTSNVTTISESYSVGSITVTGADSDAGGIAGVLTPNCQLSDSYSTATISGTLFTAGLVGRAYAASKINRCYASGNLTGIYKGAGIVGNLYDANTKTTNCVALNSILNYTDQSAWASRVIGGYDEASGNPDGSNLALATMQVSLNNVPVKKYDDLVEGIAKSEAELKQAMTYEAKGWDFENVWTMPTDGYPLLKWQLPSAVLVTGISLNQTVLNFTAAGQTATLTATITPEDATDKSVTWSSSNTAVATVDNNGKVTAVAEGTATITVKTNDGTNLSSACQVSVVTTISGDADGDGQTDVNDYIAVANYILNENFPNFNATAADINNDNSIDVTDYIGIANIILYGNWQGVPVNGIMAYSAETTLPWMEIGLQENGTIKLMLRNAKPFSAFQMDIRLSEGIEIADATMAKASQTKNLGFNKLEDGSWRLLYGSLDNKSVWLAGDEMLSLALSGSSTNIGGSVVIENILLAERNASTMRLNAVQSTLPTGITTIGQDPSDSEDYYDLTGRKVNNVKQKRGVYVINGKITFVK